MLSAKYSTYVYTFAAKGTEFGMPVVGTEADMIMSASAAGAASWNREVALTWNRGKGKMVLQVLPHSGG